MVPVWASTERADAADGSPYFVTRIATTCNNCRNVSSAVIASYDLANRVDGRTMVTDAAAILNNKSLNKNWTPQSAVSPKFPDVPEHVARAAKEAHEAASIGAHIAAILMARTVIEATAKARDIKTGNLVAKIEALRDSHHIRPGIAEAAHEIRHLGNDMAHGDVEDLPTEEDAEDVLQLMDLVLAEVFQATALTAAIRARRTAKNASD